MCMHLYMYVHMYTCTCTYMHIYTCTHVYLCIYMYVFCATINHLRHTQSCVICAMCTCYVYIYMCALYTCTCIHIYLCIYMYKYCAACSYGVATISRLFKIIGLFCRISSLLYVSFAKESYNFKEPKP